MYNNDFESNNTLNNNDSNNNFNTNNELKNNIDQYQNESNQFSNDSYNSFGGGLNTDNYQYPSYDSFDNQSVNDDEDNKKGKIFVILIIILIIFALAFGGFFIYKFISSRTSKVNDIDNIIIEGGTMNQKFSKNVDTYTVESRNDSIKLICKYKNEKVNVSECNKSILINKNEIKNITISLKDKKYTFIIARVGNDAPIINDVAGVPTDWIKESVVKVNATFSNEQADEAYSFDGGNTWQKEDSLTVDINKDLYVVVRDIQDNISSIYAINLDKIDNEAPIVTIQSIDKNTGVVTIDVKDSSSGIVGITITNSSSAPTKWDNIDLTYDTVIKYNATSTKTYYVWTKDKVGNVSFQEFSLESLDNNSSETVEPLPIPDNNSSVDNSNDNSTTTPEKKDDNSSGEVPSQNIEREKVVINNVAGNTSEWAKSITLKVLASSSISDSNLKYSFDGGRTYQNANSKTFTSNGNIKIVVRNDNTGVTSSVKQVSIKSIDNTKPKCGTITGASTTWTKDARAIKVACIDGESGCSYGAYAKTFNTTTKTSTITIRDKVGNTNTCTVNVYVDTTGPDIKYNLLTTTNNKGKEEVEKIEFTITDNYSGLNLDTIKYKQRILKKVPDITWSKRNRFDEEVVLKENYSYKYIKKVGLNKYFTVTASDLLGNVTEIEVPIE